MTRPSKSKAIERLRKLLDAIPELRLRRFGSQQFNKWRRDSQVAIAYTFGEKSTQAADLEDVSFFAPIVNPSDLISQKAYLIGLETAASVLESMIDEIDEYWEDEQRPPTTEVHRDLPRSELSNEIFIVHGRDEGMKNTVARFLEKLNLKPVILAEIAGTGRTIIEKFEEHAQVGYAVVLLTPDDAGSLRGDEDDSNPRARQNVIFELGFFIGHLGREYVCALTKGHVEIPSDYAGVEYIPFNESNDWQLKLIREFKGAGFNVDANLAI